nr:hypothetical protein [Tanacetum cinerariifolium]
MLQLSQKRPLCKGMSDTKGTGQQESRCQKKDCTSRDTKLLSIVSCEGVGSYDWSDQAKEGPTNYALMAYSNSSALSLTTEASNYSKSCLKAVENHKDRALTELQMRLDLAETEKAGIHLNVNKLKNAFKSLNKIIEYQIMDNYKKGLVYNAVPPPYTGLFLPPKLDLSSTGLEELFNEPKTEKSKNKSNDVEPKSIRKNNDAPIIKD